MWDLNFLYSILMLFLFSFFHGGPPWKPGIYVTGASCWKIVYSVAILSSKFEATWSNGLWQWGRRSLSNQIGRLQSFSVNEIKRKLTWKVVLASVIFGTSDSLGNKVQYLIWATRLKGGSWTGICDSQVIPKWLRVQSRIYSLILLGILKRSLFMSKLSIAAKRPLLSQYGQRSGWWGI